GTDPANREDMFAGAFKNAGIGGTDSFNMTHPLYQWIARLNNFRRLYPALTLGTHVNQWYDAAGPGLFAYARRWATQEVFVVFNTSDTTQGLPARNTLYPAGTTLVNLLATNETITVASGSVTPAILVPPLTVKMFISQAQLQTLDPVVLTNYPAHGAVNISPREALKFQFSRPMDTNQVQAAFAVNPPVAGVFGWSSAGDLLTFQPLGGGMAPSTNITITISNTAAAREDGKTLGGSFQVKFQTTTLPDTVYFSSPPPTNAVISLASNATYLVQACFSSGLATNEASLFTLLLNGVPQPTNGFIFRPVGAVAGCPGMRSLLYYWSSNSPGTLAGSNLWQAIYHNPGTQVTLADATVAITPPPLVIAGLSGPPATMAWASTPGKNYQVWSTTNLQQPFAALGGVVPATGLLTQFQDPATNPPASQKFYQVQVLP
ncbi:MAG TPA: Ig-like domain-containing protein, partial [Verrucomicrobiae bacterium]